METGNIAINKSISKEVENGKIVQELRDFFNLFWINGSCQKRFTAEDAERRRVMLFFSACLCGFLNRPSK